MLNNSTKYINHLDSIKVNTGFIANPQELFDTSQLLFNNHLLEVQTNTSQIHYTNYSYVLTGIFLLLYVAFVWLYVTNRKKIGQVISGFYQPQFSNANKRNDFFIGNRVSVILSLFFIITSSVFISQLVTFYDFKINTVYNLTVVIAFVICSIYIVKLMVVSVLGSVFQVQRKAQEYILLIFLFSNVLGLFLLPLVICLTYMEVSPDVFIYIGLVVIMFFLIVRSIRGFYIGLTSPQISKLYLFMYLCAFEILPFVWMAKLFLIKVQ